MTRRKNKKIRRQGSREYQPAPTAMSLDEDLRQQRLRQQQRQEEAEKKKKLEPPKQEEEPEIEVPYKRRQVRPQDMISKGMRTTTLEDLTRLPSLYLAYAQEQSPFLSPRHRQRIRQVWHSQYLLEQLQVNPRASALYSRKFKWLDHSLPDGMHCSWDLTCKHSLHPSARTFDVALFSEDDPQQQQLPTIATAVQGGWGLFQPPRGRTHRVQTLRGRPVHAIRLHESSSRCGTIVRSNHSYAPYTFQYYPLPHATSYVEAPLYEPVNDFCFGNDLVLFACPRFAGNATLTPLFLSFGRGDGELRTLNVEHFPQSDALRVEMACSSNEKYVAFGHRNGQVSLLDLRQSHTTTILQYHGDDESSSSLLGSATGLGFLSQTQKLLVKRSFGSCQLHDLRMTTTTSGAKRSSSVVFHLSVPSDEINPTLSANCNGFAVDPTCEQTLIAPYINAQQDACLGVWSLGTGAMVGSRRILAKNTTNAQQQQQQQHDDTDVLYTEVCQRTTPAFFGTSKKMKKDAPSSMFGVWLKCGRFSKSKSNCKFGSLHHAAFPGSWK